MENAFQNWCMDSCEFEEKGQEHIKESSPSLCQIKIKPFPPPDS